MKSDTYLPTMPRLVLTSNVVFTLRRSNDRNSFIPIGQNSRAAYARQQVHRPVSDRSTDQFPIQVHHWRPSFGVVEVFAKIKWVGGGGAIFLYAGFTGALQSSGVSPPKKSIAIPLLADDNGKSLLGRAKIFLSFFSSWVP